MSAVQPDVTYRRNARQLKEVFTDYTSAFDLETGQEVAAWEVELYYSESPDARVCKIGSELYVGLRNKRGKIIKLIFQLGALRSEHDLPAVMTAEAEAEKPQERDPEEAFELEIDQLASRTLACFGADSACPCGRESHEKQAEQPSHVVEIITISDIEHTEDGDYVRDSEGDYGKVLSTEFPIEAASAQERVAEVVDLLKREGCTEYSTSSFSLGGWYSAAYEDPYKDTCEEKTARLKGFSYSEAYAIYKRVIGDR